MSGAAGAARALEAAPRPERVRRVLGDATGRGVRVGVIDSGWDRSLADPRVLPGVSFVDPADDLALGFTRDDHDVLGHGTACAGQVLRIAPEARVVPIRVFGRQLETSPGTLQEALKWALEADLQVVNVSLGTTREEMLYPLYALCEKARRAGTILVAAGHNVGEWSYPAIFENVIGVAAGQFGCPYELRYRAEHALECEAWGVDQPVLWLAGQTARRHGTSFAAPNVAGIVALIKERDPAATLEEVREVLEELAVG